MKTHLLNSIILTAAISLSGYANIRGFKPFDRQRFDAITDPAEEIISADVKKVHNTLYFNLSIKNEKVEGVYVLIKIDTQGLITILKEKTCVPNSINQAILYSFSQSDPREDKNRYVLLRVSKTKGVEPLLTYGKELSREEKNIVSNEICKK